MASPWMGVTFEDEADDGCARSPCRHAFGVRVMADGGGDPDGENEGEWKCGSLSCDGDGASGWCWVDIHETDQTLPRRLTLQLKLPTHPRHRTWHAWPRPARQKPSRSSRRHGASHARTRTARSPAHRRLSSASSRDSIFQLRLHRASDIGPFALPVPASTSRAAPSMALYQASVCSQSPGNAQVTPTALANSYSATFDHQRSHPGLIGYTIRNVTVVAHRVRRGTDSVRAARAEASHPNPALDERGPESTVSALLYGLTASSNAKTRCHTGYAGIQSWQDLGRNTPISHTCTSITYCVHGKRSNRNWSSTIEASLSHPSIKTRTKDSQHTAITLSNQPIASAAIMSASIKTILIFGGTSGIGAAFASRFHKQGKKVIITGRREARLDAIKASHPGMESYVMDNTDLATIPSHLDTLFRRHPDIDTVWVNSGLQKLTSIQDLNSSSDADVILEVTTNITAPFLIARHVIPKLLARGTEANFLITSSALGFVPAPMFPVYNATKSAAHAYMVSIRQGLRDTNVNVIELVPPYVATELDVDYKGKLPVSVTPMGLQEFEDEVFDKLDNTPAQDLKEVSAGTATPRVDAWRGSIGALLAKTPFGGANFQRITSRDRCRVFPAFRSRLDHVPDILGSVAELATSHAGTEAVVADTDGVILELVGKGIGTFGHCANEDANALLGAQILDVFTNPNDGGVKGKRDLAAIWREVICDGIANDLQKLFRRSGRANREGVEQLNHKTSKAFEGSWDAHSRADLNKYALGCMDVDL
nr:putative oxidoreductase dlte [Quercus suber]